MAEHNQQDAKALELYNSGDVEGARAYLTEYVCNTMDFVYNEWWAYAWELVGKYNDGQVVDAVNKSTSGFPYTMEYLDGVDFGHSYLDAYNEMMGISAETEDTTTPETTEPEDTTTPETSEPATEPTEPAVNTETSNSTAIIIGVVAVLVVAVAAYFILKNKKKQ